MRKHKRIDDPVLAVVYHAVGGSGRGILGWRSHYFTAVDNPNCIDAVRLGWMTGPQRERDGQAYFYATPAGLDAAATASNRSYLVDYK